MVEFLKRQAFPDLAYVKTKKLEGADDTLPTVMFLGGFRSDMEGTKATSLEEACKKRRQAYIRFDYRGHGQSEGKFEEACISDWVQDALDILQACTSGPVMVVGSSLGGWIALLMALKQPQNIHSIVGLAAAPDFTIWIEEGMTADQIHSMQELGYFEMPNDYDEPYVITKKLLQDGKRNALLDSSIDISIPVRLIQGQKDADVKWQVAHRIKDQLQSDDVEIIFLENADHRLSAPEELDIINQTIYNLQK